MRVTTGRRGRRRSGTAAAPGPGRSPKVVALAAVCLGFFVIQLDVTIVNVALPAIQRGIGGTVAGLQWVVDAYTLALAAVMLTAGPAADRVGARRVFLIGLAAFAAGSAACAAAPDLGVLVAARAVQGLGAAALLPCSLSLIVHQCPGPRRGPGRWECGAGWVHPASRWARSWAGADRAVELAGDLPGQRAGLRADRMAGGPVCRRVRA